MKIWFSIAVAVTCLWTQVVDAQPKSTGIARFDAAVQRGAAYLRAQAKPDMEAGRLVLAAYALFKSGEPKESPIVQAALKTVTDSVSTGSFHPHNAYDHLYEAGLYCMFLADVDPVQYKPQMQIIADYVASVQRPDGSWSDTSQAPGDISMCQYAVLALWAANRAKCTVSPEALDRTVIYHLNNRNQDGGYTYRPGTSIGTTGANSSRNMTMAAISSLGVTRLLFYGPQNLVEEKPAETKFGVLEKDEDRTAADVALAFPDYRPQNSKGTITAGIDRSIAFEIANFNPVNINANFPIYFYYSAERALSVSEIDKVRGVDWYVTYGDGLLTLQAQDGSFTETHSGPVVGTSFALLYYMRSTKQIFDKTYGKGSQQGNRGNPFGNKNKDKPPTELDLLIADLEKVDFKDLDESQANFADELVRSVISIDDPQTLVGQEEKLRKLVQHPNWQVRQACCWALGRTGDFRLIPMMLEMLRDPSIDVNVEAIQALRYISRKPNGFGESLDPLKGLENPTPEQKLEVANTWRQKTLKAWSEWYNSIRPHEEKDTFEELLLAVPINTKDALPAGLSR